MTTLTLRDPGLLSAASSGLWTPASITTGFWFDASDATTITTVGGKVSAWSDKSGNARDVSQSVDASRPTYAATGQNGLGEVQFNGHRLERTQADVSTSWTCVIAARNNTTIGNQCMVGFGSTTAANPRWQLDRNGTTARMIRRNDAGSIAQAEQGTHTVSAFIQAGTCDGSLVGVSLNGASLATVAAPAGVFTVNRLTLGAIYAGTSTPTLLLNGEIYEVVYAPSMLSTLDRERIEGYLAHKWGLASVLPAGHTFKSAAPTL